jgi:hypothetical protein
LSVGTFIPQIADLLNRISLTSIAAELRESVGIVIPQIINLLKDNNWTVRVADVEALLRLSEQGV